MATSLATDSNDILAEQRRIGECSEFTRKETAFQYYSRQTGIMKFHG